LAESAQKLSAESKELHPEIFWQGIAGFRNVLVHDYLGINHERARAVVEEELPKLKAVATSLLRIME